MNLFFQIQSLQSLIFCMVIRRFWPIWIMFFQVFFSNIIKVNQFLYCFLISLPLISSLSLTRSFLVTYAYVSIESNQLISLLELSLFQYWFIVSSELFMIFLMLPRSIFLDSLFYSQFELLLNSFYYSQI